MTELVSTYGLSALFLGVVLESAGIPVPGETALIVASVLATRGIFALTSVIAVAAVAAVVGDNIGYWTGLRGGRRLVMPTVFCRPPSASLGPTEVRASSSRGSSRCCGSLGRLRPVWHGWTGGGSFYGTWQAGWPGRRPSLSSPTTSGRRRSRRWAALGWWAPRS